MEQQPDGYQPEGAHRLCGRTSGDQQADRDQPADPSEPSGEDAPDDRERRHPGDHDREADREVGQTSAQVALELGITPKTVGAHIEHIYAKIGASNRSVATLFAMQHGLI